MVFSEAKPGMIIKILRSGNKYLVATPFGMANSYRLDTCSFYWIEGDIEVQHIGYIAIETVPKATEFISVARK